MVDQTKPSTYLLLRVIISQMKKISFSIITPTYNRLKSGFLEQCIKSVQQQEGNSFTFEHIIINDASTDDTKDWLETASKNMDNLVVINHTARCDTAAGYADGLGAAKNEYIIFMDDDDLLPIRSLKIRAQFIIDNPKLDWFYGKADWINETGKSIDVKYQSTFPKDLLYERALIKNFIHNGTPTIKRTALNGISWPSWLTKRQDYFLWLELLKPSLKLTVGFIDKVIFTYRIHQNAFTTSWQEEDEIKKFIDDLGYRIKKEYHSESLANMASIANEQLYEIRRLKKK